ncbi:MAG TPA: serine hydrolase [Gemmatimonadota bacterium]|nr:serine hydrolase [Gemmatimonadota bacterium]
MRRSAFVFLFFLSLAFPSLAAAQHAIASASAESDVAAVMQGLSFPVEIADRESAREPIGERLDFHRVPGVAVAVVREGELRWARGFGVKEAGSPDSIRAETLFQGASISKPVTALVALRLVEEGVLGLDRPVNESLTSWRIPENEFTVGHPVTLRQLLSHSAGTTNAAVGIYGPEERRPTLLEALNGTPPSKVSPVRVDFEPGTRARYSGGGYSVIQQLVVDVTGEPFAQAARRLVLDPLGMRESGFHQPLPDSLAWAVSTGHGGDGQPIPGRWWTLPEMAAGGLWSTAPDLARLAIGLVSAWREEEGALLAPQLAREMMRDQIDGFGLGLMVDRPGGELRLTHTGSNDGYRAIVVVYPERGDAIAVMTNGDRGDALRDEIVRAAAREHGWPGYEPTVRRVAEVDQETLSSLVGTYDYGGGYRTVITLEEGRLWARLGDGPAWELFPETESRFFSLGGATYTFVRDSAGTVTGVEADVGAGRPFEGRKT